MDNTSAGSNRHVSFFLVNIQLR